MAPKQYPTAPILGDDGVDFCSRVRSRAVAAVVDPVLQVDAGEFVDLDGVAVEGLYDERDVPPRCELVGKKHAVLPDT